MKSLICFFLLLLIFLVVPMTVAAAPVKVFTDPVSGHEVWQMTNGSQFEGPDYYTSPLFSPNGKYFVYHDSNASPTRLSIMNADGTNKRTLGNFSGWGNAAFGWWANDSSYYYYSQGLYRIKPDTNQSEQVPNAASALPFYFPMLSPDDRVISGIANSSDTTSRGTMKFINTDGTNYRSFQAPVQPSGSGFDVTHGWVGNNYAWYLNNSVNLTYRNIIRVIDINTGSYVGTLNALMPEGTDWTGLFGHPALTDEGYMMGGAAGKVAGQCSCSGYGSNGILRANTLLVNTAGDIPAKMLTGVVDLNKFPNFTPLGYHWNFSPDGKFFLINNVQNNCSVLAEYPVDKSVSPSWLAAFGPASTCEMNSYYDAYQTYSPDGTKAIFGSSYKIELATTNGRNTPKSPAEPDIYIAIVKKPDPPTNLQALNISSQVKLTWKPAFSHREIKEYQVFGSNSQNGTYNQLATVPALYTYLDAPSKITASATSVNVDSTAGFPDQGTIEIYGLSSERPTEIISYAGKTATSFTGLTRGVMGSTAAEHWNNSFVWLYTGSLGYQATQATNSWFRIKSVEWSGLTSDFSTAVTIGGSPSPSSTLSPTPALKSGDANGDGKVDDLDYTIWANNYGITNATGPRQGDFNNDKKVDDLDYTIWANNYGK